MDDHVDYVLDQWAAQRPDLDVSAMAVIGRLKRVSKIVEARLLRTFAEHGLDGASFDVLATLRRSEPPQRLTPAQLVGAAMVTSGAMSQRLDRLEARGLITRTPSPSDGRSVQVALTDRGRALIDQALPDHLATLNRLLGSLDADQRDELADALSELLVSLGDGISADRGDRVPRPH